MLVSHDNVKKFLLELINQSQFPGNMVEFVSAVKLEISSAAVQAAPEPVQKGDQASV